MISLIQVQNNLILLHRRLYDVISDDNICESVNRVVLLMETRAGAINKTVKLDGENSDLGGGVWWGGGVGAGLWK